MKNLFKVRSIVAIIMVTAIAILAFAGCTGSDGKSGKESTASNPMSSVVEEKSIEESSESVVESKEESKVESNVESESKSSFVSQDTSDIQSNTDSDNESSGSGITEEKSLRYGRIIEISPIIDPATNDIFPMQADTLIVISAFNDEDVYNTNGDTFDIIISGRKFYIMQRVVELFPEDYVPDFTDPHWAKIEE